MAAQGVLACVRQLLRPFGNDLFISIGTSGNVYPASGFVADARGNGAHTVELNLEPSEGVRLFSEAVHGRATEVVPAYVERLLGG